MKPTILDTKSVSPLYRQLMQQLRIDITAGKYPPESRIPSESELCSLYGVSRVTVRKALAELTDMGLLERHQGKGTFVTAHRLESSLRELTSFHQLCEMNGCTPGTKVIAAGVIPADEETCHLLRLNGDKSARVVEITRLRLADDQPVMMERNRFPLDCAWLLEEDLTASLYRLLKDHGRRPAGGQHQISLAHATPDMAELLAVSEGEALLRLDQVICDDGGQPLHISHQLIRGDRFVFTI